MNEALQALRELVMSRFSYFEKLANLWHTAGATSFEIVGGGEQIMRWDYPGNSAGVVIAPLEVDGEIIGELRIQGLDEQLVFDRLEADATALDNLIRYEVELGMLTSELVQNQDQLLALYDLSRSMRRYLSPEEILATLCREAARLCSCDKAFALLAEPIKPALLIQYPENFLEEQQAQELLHRTQANGKPLVVNCGCNGTKNLLFLPITVNNAPFAGLGLANHTEAFSMPVIKLAQAITQYAGAQLENSILYSETLSQARMRSELELASSIQLRLLPQKFPSVKGLDIYAASCPARQVGGDFYNFISQSNGSLNFVVGDVSGKGLPAALMMAMARIAFQNASRFSKTMDPAKLMSRVNEDLYGDCSDLSMFITAFYGFYEPATRCLSYANAGHSPVIYCKADGSIQFFEADGTALGVLPISLSERQEVKLEYGDLLVVATDGFSEAFNSVGEMYGYDRLLELVKNNRSLSAQHISDLLFKKVLEHEAGVEQSDDRTLVVLKGIE
ncbi:MAG: SpoIIE family protein phosphatase [Chloroflexi bacterium]|uniref:SpoIIE family protein phosphatase n=1 Tax=Candidatus Chlorohelix allophototropha TaxID=3003348 RepID=A0A8T7LUC2_9CHLR|nr:SpoIIE family protein phosphatase [Chloroflexota bacterium]WJW66338.1 SpoIIE family protein phosphatase [Chloroflexota bacterium L227-S17]